jgi:hypothetical protein
MPICGSPGISTVVAPMATHRVLSGACDASFPMCDQATVVRVHQSLPHVAATEKH